VTVVLNVAAAFVVTAVVGVSLCRFLLQGEEAEATINVLQRDFNSVNRLAPNRAADTVWSASRNDGSGCCWCLWRWRWFLSMVRCELLEGIIGGGDDECCDDDDDSLDRFMTMMLRLLFL